MRITSIQLAGTIEKGKKLPRAYACIARTTDSEYIEVTILTPGRERKHMVLAGCEEDIRSMAEALQRVLDGHDGTCGDIQEYVCVLQHFAD